MSGMTTRRRSLALVAGVATLPLLGLAGERLAPRFTWQGIVLGGQAHVTLVGLNEYDARRTVATVLDEIVRLERSLSLYRADSALVALNRDGALDPAPGDLRTVLAAALRMSELSGGAFDPAIQPHWQPLARGLDATAPTARYQDIDLRETAVRLGRAGMALTFDGIAQGYITDRIADVLADAGLTHALLNLGEIRALGPDADGSPWQIGLAGSAGVLTLDGGACATSASERIIDPATGAFLAAGRNVTVRHGSAMWADALSTALSLVGPDQAALLLAKTGGQDALFYGRDGPSCHVRAA